MTGLPRKSDERGSSAAQGSQGRPGGLSRRQALARLGLGAAVAYSAPVVMHLDRSANAKVVPTPCPKGKGKAVGAWWCRGRSRR